MNKSSKQNSPQSKTPESMTGYHVVECLIHERLYRLHLKSVNNKYFDLKWRAPRNWLALEFEVRKLLQKEFSRGSFDFWVEEIPQPNKNTNSAKSYLKTLEQNLLNSLENIDQKIISYETAASLLGKSPELWFENPKSQPIDKESIHQILIELLQGLKTERNKEGKALLDVLITQVKHIKEQHQTVLKHIPKLREKISENYKERIQELVNEKVISETFEGRLQSEILFLLERRDISEELERVNIHIHKLSDLLQNPINNLGKRVDFLAQELNREWSTLGNKIHDTDLLECVTESKLSIDKIREQALNLA